AGRRVLRLPVCRRGRDGLPRICRLPAERGRRRDAGWHVVRRLRRGLPASFLRELRRKLAEGARPDRRRGSPGAVSPGSGPTVAEVGEFGLIDRLKRRFGSGGSGVVLGIGDDTAVLEVTPGRVLLATTDAEIEGVHFRRDRTTPEVL